MKIINISPIKNKTINSPQLWWNNCKIINEKNNIESFIRGKILLYSSLQYSVNMNNSRNTDRVDSRYKFIAEHTSDGIVLIKNDIIEFVSNSYYKILGYLPSAMMGEQFSSLLELLHPEELDIVQQSLRNAIDNRISEMRYETRLKHNNGNYIWIEDNISFEYNLNGGLKYILIVAREIEERKVAEAEIINANNELNQLVDIRTQELEVAVEKLEERNIELELLVKQLSIDSIEINRLNNELRILNGKYIDINRHLEQQVQLKTNEYLIAMEKAQESDRLKSSFINNLNHEIRTPLNGILGNAEILVHDFLDVEDKKELHSALRLSCDRLLLTINNMIEISKLEAGIVKPRFRIFYPYMIMDNLYDVFSNVAQKKGLNLICQVIKQQSETKIRSDEQRIFQVMSIFLNNAIKYTELGQIRYGYIIQNKGIEFFVEDTGIGIAPKVKNNIFEKFYQEDYELSRKYEGSGLGLSIANACIKLLGGIINVESEKAIGSRFSFIIPK